MTEPTLEFTTNPEPRCACLLLLDTSGSMNGQRIDAVNKGLRDFVADVRKDERATARSEIAIMTFDDEIKLVQDFKTVDNFEAPTLTAQGQTFIGRALLEALRRLEARKQVYKENGIGYYRPWLFVITDGEPQGESPADLENAASQISTAQREKRVAVFPIAVGEADAETLARITGARPKRLDETKWRELFEWFSKSLSKRAASKPGAQVKFDNAPWEMGT